MHSSHLFNAQSWNSHLPEHITDNAQCFWINQVWEQSLHAVLLSVEIKKCELCAMKRGKDEQSFQTISPSIRKYSMNPIENAKSSLKDWVIAPIPPFSAKSITYQTLCPKKWKHFSWLRKQCKQTFRSKKNWSQAHFQMATPLTLPTVSRREWIYCGTRWNPLGLLFHTPFSSLLPTFFVSSVNPAIVGIVETASCLQFIPKAHYQR